MRARFLADADLHPQIVSGLKRIEPAIDFETAQAAALRGVPDPEVLRMAAEKNRIVVSHDRRTMPGAFYVFLRTRTSPGLILISQGFPIGRAIDELQICYHNLEPEEFANQILYLPL